MSESMYAMPYYADAARVIILLYTNNGTLISLRDPSFGIVLCQYQNTILIQERRSTKHIRIKKTLEESILFAGVAKRVRFCSYTPSNATPRSFLSRLPVTWLLYLIKGFERRHLVLHLWAPLYNRPNSDDCLVMLW